MDYMMEHLTANGRAGIIVPEGIIFQSQKAYRQLRKMLVEDYLVAVVSLPAGVFKPYSGVKTSILILDRALARRTDAIVFFKVENDGFDLGDQRRPIDKNDLPQVECELVEYLDHLRSGEPGEDSKHTFGQLVLKEVIAADREYSLRGDRYRKGTKVDSIFPFVELRTIAQIAAGNPAPQDEAYFSNGQFSFVRTSDVGTVHRSSHFVGTADQVNRKAVDELRLRRFPRGTILFPKSGASTFLNHRVRLGEPAYVASHLATIVCDEKKASSEYVYRLLCQMDARSITPDQAYPSLRLKEIGNIRIPLPPLEFQAVLVKEIEGYQKVIDGARAVVENYRPHIAVDPEWPKHSLGTLAENLDSRRVPVSKGQRKSGPYPYYGASGVVDYVDGFIFDEDILLISEDGANLLARSTPIAFSVSGKSWVNNHAHVLKFRSWATQKYVECYLNAVSIEEYVTGSAQPKLNQKALNGIQIPLLNDSAILESLIADVEARTIHHRSEPRVDSTVRGKDSCHHRKGVGGRDGCSGGRVGYR